MRYVNLGADGRHMGCEILQPRVENYAGNEVMLDYPTRSDTNCALRSLTLGIPVRHHLKRSSGQFRLQVVLN